MLKDPTRVGEFMPAEKRREKAIDFKSTHFKLGGGVDTEFPKSTNQVNYTPVKIYGSQLRSPVDSNLIRRTNFILGNDKYKGGTTTSETYKGARSIGPAKQNASSDIRNAHFKLGSSGNSYLTETQREYYKKEAALTQKQFRAQKELEGKIRSHHFNFGGNKPTYSTTHALTYQGEQNKNGSKSTTNFGAEVRQAHFDLGKGGTPFVTTNQLNFTSKVVMFSQQHGERATIHNLNTQGTSIRFAGYGHRNMSCGESVSRTQFQKWPSNFEQAKLSSETKQDLRGIARWLKLGTHFNIGGKKNDGGGFVSENHGQFSHKRPLSVGIAPKNKLQQNSFTIGDPRCAYNFGTTYALSNPKREMPQKSSSQGKLALKSNLNIGAGGKGRYSTEAKSNYIPHQPGSGAIDQKYLTLVKGDHFPNSGKKGSYATENQSSFNYKGDPVQIRSFLEKEKKDDLQSSHFKIGSQPNNFMTVNQSTYNLKPKMYSDLRVSPVPFDMRHNSFKISVSSQKGTYGTEQRDQFRWVQPTPAKKY